MSWFQVTVDQDALSRGPISEEARRTLRTLTRWGVTVHAEGAALVLEGAEGVIYGITQQGHLLGPIVKHRGDLYRLAAMTTSTTGGRA